MMHYPPWSCNGPLAAATPGGLFFVCRRHGQEWPLEMAVGRERGDEGYRAQVLRQERLLKLNLPALEPSRTPPPARGAGRITVDAREKE